MTKDWLQFVSALVTQLLLLALVIGFRREIADILRRITSLSVGSTRLEATQPEDREDEIPVSAALKAELQVLDAAGFLSQAGCVQIAEAAGLLASGDAIQDSLLLFRTTKQHTWAFG